VKGLEKLLGRVGLFGGLSSRELKEVAQAGREIEFRAGNVIVERGLQGMDFYLILDGQARLDVPKKKSRVLGPGDYFGEISVLDGGPRTATITAETHVLAFRLSRPQAVKLLDRHAAMGRKILVEMCGRLRHAESRMSPE